MALIYCPECNQTVSSDAPACPACGYPVAGRARRRKDRKRSNRRPQQQQQTTVIHNKGGVSCLGCFIWMVILFFILPLAFGVLKLKLITDFFKGLGGG